MLRIFIFAVLSSTAISYDHTNPQHRTKRWMKIENATFTFDCTRRAVGFYADVEYDCQIFHMCDEEGHRIPHLCANDTSFNQEYRICDWDYNFNCAEAPKWFYLNELTYAIDDEEFKK